MPFVDQFGIYFCNRCTARLCRLDWNTYAEHGISLREEAEIQGLDHYDGEPEHCNSCGKER